MLSATTVGGIGEYITAASIASLGWKVGLAQQDALDLIAFNEDGSEFYRIQVKSAQLYANGNRRPGYQFQNGSGRAKKILEPYKYDILAHCAINHRCCVFYASHSVNQLTQRYAPERFLDLSIEQESWNKALEILRGVEGS